KDLLWSHYIHSELETNQEQFYCLQLLNYIKQNIDFRFDKELNEKIRLYKNSGLNEMTSNFDSLIKDIQGKPQELKPYGEGRFSISQGFSFSNDFSKENKGLQFLQLLIESGYPLSLQSIYLYDFEKVYQIFNSVFEYYPYPTIFYCLQFSDEKFLKRLGQDFAYSEALKDDLHQIVPILLNSYLSNDTPKRYKKSILLFCSELLIAVTPT